MNYECETKHFMLFSDAVINKSTLCFLIFKAGGILCQDSVEADYCIA